MGGTGPQDLEKGARGPVWERAGGNEATGATSNTTTTALEASCITLLLRLRALRALHSFFFLSQSLERPAASTSQVVLRKDSRRGTFSISCMAHVLELTRKCNFVP
jgi:hypothetical protein